MTFLAGRRSSRTAASVVAFCLAALPVNVFLGYLLRSAPPPASSGWPLTTILFMTTIAVFPVMGALIVSKRPDNRIGWLFLATGVTFTVTLLLGQYAAEGLLVHRGLPGASAAGALSDASWLPATAVSGAFLFLLFPDGHLPSRRWRPVGVAVVAAVAVSFAGTVLFEPKLYGYPQASNPLSLFPSEALFSVLSGLSLLVILGAAVAGVVSLFVRFRRAGSEQRHQIKWFVYVALVTVPIYVASAIAEASPLLEVLSALSLMALPTAIAVAILKYRLYEIDVVINKTLVYGALAAFITLVYVAIVVGVGAAVGSSGRPNVALSILATAVVAVAFQPMRERVQRVANRLVYGQRSTPYEALATFSDRAAGTLGATEILPRMARMLADATGAASTCVWLAEGDQLRPAASFPEPNSLEPRVLERSDALPAFADATLALPVHHRDELLGAITLTKQAGERLTPTEEQLTRDLASQAGLVLHNVRLADELRARIEELRASRRRLVAAQDAARRRLERNIHDGAQQQLVALSVKTNLARQLVAKKPDAATPMITSLRDDVDHALRDLDELASGIVPAALTELGLVDALRAQAARAALPVSIEADTLPDMAEETAAAVYFSVLEALQNVAKYANASHATVAVRATDDVLTFAVGDDGTGFDTSTTTYGTGLQGIADRLAAIGGELKVESARGAGTTVVGRVPIAATNQVAAGAQEAVAASQASASRSGPNADFGM